MPQFSKVHWPAGGPVRDLLEYLDALHRDDGRPSYTTIGKALGLSPSTLSPWFAGKRLIGKGNLEAVVDFLGGDTGKAERLRRKAAAGWKERPAPALANGPAEDEVMVAARDSYLRWIIQSTEHVPVRGLVRGQGAIQLPLDHVYVALRVDPSSPTERMNAGANLRRELDAWLEGRDLDPEEEDRQRWYLYADLPVADYFSVPSAARGDAPTVWRVDEFYRNHAVGVLLGDPGGGKTTIMRWLALTHARAHSAGLTEVRVPGRYLDVGSEDAPEDILLGDVLLPVLVRVGEYAAERQARASKGEVPRPLLEFLGHHSWDHRRPVWCRDVGDHRLNEQIPGEIIARLLDDAVRGHRALVVLDGLDEVAAEERVDTAESVAEFIRGWGGRDVVGGGPTNRIYVTSRIAGYQLAPLPTDLAQVTVEPLTNSALDVFVRQWFRQIGAVLEGRGLGDGEDPGELADRLIDLLGRSENRHARDLASNPLLAGVVVSVFLNGVGTLPPQRVELYQAAVDSLVEAWSHRVGRGRTALRIEYATIIEAIPAVAAHIQDTKPSGVIRRVEFRQGLLAELARRRDTKLTPQLVVEVDDLLTTMGVELGLVMESGPGALRFSHLTFQEYLAARHLCDPLDTAAERITAKLGDPRWREPILMAIALVNWETSDLPELAGRLLATEGTLVDLFPESALLLAAAIPQMTGVASEVIRLVVTHLIAAYAGLIAHERLPKVRELIEAALTTLRSGEHRAEVDEALADALIRPEDGNPATASATASLALAVDAANPRVALALLEARDRWDGPATAYRITTALARLIAPVVGSTRDDVLEPRLPADWGSGRLRFRDALRHNAEMTERVTGDARWQRLVLSVYGGQWTLGAAGAFDEYHRIVSYLGLADFARDQFVTWFGLRWGHDDPVYNMAVYLDTAGVDLQRSWSTPPRFEVDAITRDSSLTSWVLHALRSDDVPGLVELLRSRLRSGGLDHRADTLVALWALGEDVAADLAADDPGAVKARTRISGLAVELRDATVRARTRVPTALNRAVGSLPAADWDHLHSALTSTLLGAGAAPLSLGELGDVPESSLAGLLAEDFTRHITGWGDDPLHEGASFADRVTDRGFRPQLLIEALTRRGAARNNSFALYSSHWPADRLAWSYRGEDDIPESVLDQIGRIPPSMTFAPEWVSTCLLAPMVGRNPDLLPEALTVAWTIARRDADFLARIDGLDPALSAAVDPVAYLCEVARATSDRWHRARALLRLADTYTACRAALVADAVADITHVTDPLRRFRLLERVLPVCEPQDRESHLDALRDLVPQLDDHADQARALLRLARFLSAPDCDAPVVEAVALAGVMTDRADLVTTLRLALGAFPDRDAVRAAVLGAVDASSLTATEVADVFDRVAHTIDSHLDVLATDAERAQVWVPVALYAQAAQADRDADADRLRRAWAAMAADPGPETVTAVLDLHHQPTITCTGPVARSVEQAFALAPDAVEPLLGRLTRLDCDAEHRVRGWLGHADQRLRRVSALLLGELRGIDGDLVAPVIDMLMDDDDLLRARARNLLDHGVQHNATRSSVSRLGQAGIEALCGVANAHEWDEPAVRLLVSRHLTGTLHDDASAVTAWCDAVDQDDDAVAATCLGMIYSFTEPVWSVLVDRVSRGTPATRRAILESTAVSAFQTRHLPELRLTDDRWSELRSVLRDLDPGSTTAVPVLLCGFEDVVAAAATSLEASGGVFDQDSASRATAALWEGCGTDMGKILSRGADMDIFSTLASVGSLVFTSRDEAGEARTALHRAMGLPGRQSWDWVPLLAAWTDRLLTESVHDDLYCDERSRLLVLTAAAAESNPDTFRRSCHPEALSARLAEAATKHNSYNGRRDAAYLLGVLRHGSTTVLDALQHCLVDVHQVCTAALEAIPRLRDIDQAVIDGLLTSLHDDSTLSAWAAAQLLSTLGQKSTLPTAVRQQIITALAEETRDRRARRSVYFSYVAAPIPDMPELDDVFAEALRRVYRFGVPD